MLTYNPLVTIGVSSYNRPEGLEKVLQYLLHQPYPNILVIISDDASTNPEVQYVIDKYLKLDSRIITRIRSINQGAECNLDTLKRCGNFSKYFMWMSDDDSFDDDYIWQCIEFLEDNPDYVLCSGTGKIFNKGEFLFQERNLTLDSHSPRKRLFTYFRYVFKNSLMYGVMHNRKIHDLGMENHVGSDWSFVGNLALLGKVKVLDTVYMRKDDNGISSSRKKMIKRWNLNKFWSVFFESYSSYKIASSLRTGLFTKVVVFLFLNCKFLYNSIKRRL